MKLRSFAFVGASLALGLFGAAASTSSGDSGTDGTTGGDSSTKDSGIVNDPQNCVPPGTPNNANGVGGYCTPLGGQCDTAGPGGAARICTADLTSTPAHAWFCTFPCEHTSDCGSGSVCFESDQGSGCVPTACLSLNADAGHVIEDDAGDGGDGG